MKAVLFDLDGTLLQLDFELFLKEYTRMISYYCQSIAEPAIFAETLFKSTAKMIANDGSLTNSEVFMRDFIPRLNTKEEIIYPLLERFYEEEFPKLRRVAQHNPLSARIVEAVLEKGRSIVLATNPLFPRSAIIERMRWAGIDGYPWAYISSYEESRACKPNPLFYRELAERLGLSPEECWMIGNDAGEDGIAAAVGFKTYLVTDYLIAREGYPKPQGQGTLEELLDYIRKEFV